MPERLLEIGGGHSPAIQNPGWLFDAKDLSYFAADYNGTSRVIDYKYDPLSGDYDYDLYETACRAAMHALPFRDNTIKHVIMKSVIGEYSIQLHRDANPRATNGLSGQAFANAMAGFRDILRVLEPGGILAVSEEDTPADCLQLSSHLSGLGYADIELTPYCPEAFDWTFRYDPPDYRSPFDERGFTHASPQWLTVRSAYWAVEERRRERGRRTALTQVDYVAEDYWRTSYIVTARKPTADPA